MKRKFLDHVVVEEKKEVWFRGDYPTCMAIPTWMKQNYPGYTSHITNVEHLDKLRQEQWQKMVVVSPWVLSWGEHSLDT